MEGDSVAPATQLSYDFSLEPLDFLEGARSTGNLFGA